MASTAPAMRTGAASRAMVRQNRSSFARALRPAAYEARGHHDRVHRARAIAADANDLKPRVLQNRVKRAPGIGAVRATALKRQVDALGFVHAAVHPPSIDRLAPVICEAASEQR